MLHRERFRAMECRRLGSTGRRVSRLGLGCGNFGGIFTSPIQTRRSTRRDRRSMTRSRVSRIGGVRRCGMRPRGAPRARERVGTPSTVCRRGDHRPPNGGSSRRSADVDDDFAVRRRSENSSRALRGVERCRLVCHDSGAASNYGLPLAFWGFGPVHDQPWISQPLAPFFRTNVICAASRMATPRSLKV